MIEYDDITVSFKNKLIINNFSLKINKGDKIIIHGKSGSGKTTLINLLLGFVKPDTGKILFNKISIQDTTLSHIRNVTAYVPQDFNFWQIKVKDIINEIFSYKINKNNHPNDDEIISILHVFELNSQILEQNFALLSGGEKQRVLISIAILLKRNLYILDEPCSALDYQLKEKVMNYFINNDTTAIIISHDKEWLISKSIKAINMEDVT